MSPGTAHTRTLLRAVGGTGVGLGVGREEEEEGAEARLLRCRLSWTPSGRGLARWVGAEPLRLRGALSVLVVAPVLLAVTVWAAPALFTWRRRLRGLAADASISSAFLFLREQVSAPLFKIFSFQRVLSELLSTSTPLLVGSARDRDPHPT